MAAIGGVSCTTVKGGGIDLSQSVSTWRVPGRDGVGAQKLGKSDSRWSFVGMLLDSSANVQTWVANITSLKGAIIGVTDDFVVTHTGLLVTNVSQPQRKGVVYNGTLQVRAEIRVSGVVTA